MRALAVLAVVLLAAEAVHAQTYAVVRTSIFGTCNCPRQPQPQPAGPDPATIGMLGNVLSNQGQILYQLGRLQGQGGNQSTPIIMAPLATPAVPVVPYQPQTLPISYNPQPLPGGYNPQPLPPSYNPQPLPPSYNPTPLPGGYTPQIIVAPSIGGGTPGAGGGYNPAPLPVEPGSRGGPPGYGGGGAPGIDFRFYGPTAMGYDVRGRNGVATPPAPQPQSFTRSPRSPR